MDAIRAQLEEREYDRMTMDVRRQELTENERGEMVSFSSSLGEGVRAFVCVCVVCNVCVCVCVCVCVFFEFPAPLEKVSLSLSFSLSPPPRSPQNPKIQ
jgi:hypothetical protein